MPLVGLVVDIVRANFIPEVLLPCCKSGRRGLLDLDANPLPPFIVNTTTQPIVSKTISLDFDRKTAAV